MTTLPDSDVVVVGGGPGGFAAAVSAARQGARTVLLEREGCLGGGMTTMLVCPFMGHMTTPGPSGEPRQVVNAGVFRDICERIEPLGPVPDSICVNFDDENMKRVLDDMTAEAGVEVVFHAALYDVEMQNRRVAAALFAHNAGPLRVAGRVFVDGTGDSLLAARAGASFEIGDETGTVMPMTTNFVVGGVDTSVIPDRAAMKAFFAKGDKDTPPLLNTHYSTYAAKPNGIVHFNAVRVTGRTLDPQDLSRAEIEGRKRAENCLPWLRANVPGFRNAYLIKTGAHIGVRESRRVLGDYVLTYDDWKNCARFDDAIAGSSYGVDVHGQQPNRTRLERLPPGGYYQIPYRCLTPRDLDNLLVAGRGISADEAAHSSLRIMPTVLCIGHAAGIAAALSLPSGDTRKVPVPELQRRIRSSGGVI